MSKTYRLAECQSCPKQNFCDGTVDLYSGANIESDESLKPSITLFGRIACSQEIDSADIKASRQIYIGAAEMYQDFQARYDKSVKLLRVSQRQTRIGDELVSNY